jgi:hypothetical protein
VAVSAVAAVVGTILLLAALISLAVVLLGR